ncbi:hypothetical protein [Hymenobacter cellulosivorans]|uniref:DUF1656 domain-containing protein n=1 Tax=Hymenobacter cellulosivorans TaxID=2932249 RepID=A0ABY4F5K9_9BACT|nr:hypothetical protein [Hymenobacter cellulosivorans]UOQ51605.1 hypothetical protein MUN80_17800 [Hymenobacter cellulosivorans]
MMLSEMTWSQGPTNYLALFGFLVVGFLIGTALWWSALKLYRSMYRDWRILGTFLIVVAALYSIAFVVFVVLALVFA